MQHQAKMGTRPLAAIEVPKFIIKPKAGKQKFGNEKTTVDGVKFDSRVEATRWQQLEMMEKAGIITNLRRQVAFELAPPVKLNGKTKPALRYFADACYTEDGIDVVEDTKSPSTKKTAIYRAKKHLMATVHGIEIREVTGKRGK